MNQEKPKATPEVVTTPPISEGSSETPPPAHTNTNTAETVTVPPISETGTPPATGSETPPPPLQPEPETPTGAEPLKTTPAAATAPVSRTRSFEDWLKEDWTQGNSDLAKKHGISRQAVAQMRKKVEAHKAGAPLFEDLPGNQPQTATLVSKVVDYDLMASSVFDMSTGMAVMIFGPEWKPRQPQEPGQPGERDIVVGALKNYFQSKQMQDIPPGLLLTAVCLAYAAPRLREPNTSSKLKMGWTWLKLKVASFRKKKVS